MSFEAFDKKEMAQYAKEVSERWGNTNAFKEFQQNTKDTTDEEQGKIGQQLMSLFVEIGQLRELEPTEPSIQ